MAKDVFGNEIPTGKAGEAATSNLYAEVAGRNPNLSSDEVSKQVAGILGSATSDQVGNYAQRNFGNLFTSGSSGSGTAPAGAVQQALDADASSAMTIEDIRAREREAREGRRIEADSIFDPKIRQAQELGERQEGSAKAQLGVTRGLGLSSTEMSYINLIEEQAQERIDDIEKQKREYISTGDSAAAERADNAIFQLEQMKTDLLFKKAMLADRLLSRQESSRQFDESLGFQKEEATFQRGIIGQEQLRADRALDFQLGSEDREIAAEIRAVAAQERQAVQGLMAQFPTVGITSQDSIDTAITKAGPQIDETRKLELEQLRANVARTRQLANSGGVNITGTASEGFSDLKTENAVRGDVRSMAENVLAGNITTEQGYNLLRSSFSDDQVDDDTLTSIWLQANGVNPAGAEDLPGEITSETGGGRYSREGASPAANLVTGAAGTVGSGFESLYNFLFGGNN